jgi:hypothetical protein
MPKSSFFPSVFIRVHRWLIRLWDRIGCRHLHGMARLRLLARRQGTHHGLRFVERFLVLAGGRGVGV